MRPQGLAGGVAGDDTSPADGVQRVETRSRRTSMSEPAKLFEEPLVSGDWCVEREDDDGKVELAIFSGPDARDRALSIRRLAISAVHRTTLAASGRSDR